MSRYLDLDLDIESSEFEIINVYIEREGTTGDKNIDTCSLSVLNTPRWHTGAPSAGW